MTTKEKIEKNIRRLMNRNSEVAKSYRRIGYWMLQASKLQRIAQRNGNPIHYINILGK